MEHKRSHGFLKTKTKIPLIVNSKVTIIICTKWYNISTFFHQFLFAWFDR